MNLPRFNSSLTAEPVSVVPIRTQIPSVNLVCDWPVLLPGFSDTDGYIRKKKKTMLRSYDWHTVRGSVREFKELIRES